MAVNLKKNKAALEKAWEEIHEPSNKYDWVIFGYEGQSSDLKIVSQGEDGLEELVDDLNDGKIMYAGLRVKDPNTGLPKIVFINWQGEGVPSNVKGKCANHLRDITNMFRGAHVQINARCEEDMEEDLIIEKVKNASGANYSFHKEKPKAFVPQGNIGSVYQKKRADLEINSSNRSMFWAEQEKEENRRKEEEQQRLEQEKMKESRGRALREKQEAETREAMIRDRSKSIDQQRNLSAKESENRREEEKKKYEETLKESIKNDEIFRNRADFDRRKRLDEANQLIRKRQESFDGTSPRDVFEKEANTTVNKKPGPLPSTKPKKVPVPFPSEDSESARTSNPIHQSSPPVIETSLSPDRETSPLGGRGPSPPLNAVGELEPSPVYESPIPTEMEPSSYPAPEEVSPSPSKEVIQLPMREPSPEFIATKALPTEPVDDSSSNVLSSQEEPTKHVQTISAKAIYDYQAIDDTEITFNPDDIITNIEKIDDGWWRGMAPNGYIGLFPANYVEEIKDKVDNSLSARALYDYQAEDETEITFDPGDIITNIEQIDEGWWRGYASNGHCGLFPANYVELL